MAKSPARRSRRAPRRRALRQPPAQSGAPRVRIGPVVLWRELPAVVRAMGDTVREPDLVAFQRLILGLTEPLRELELLVPLAERAVAGDAHAVADLRGRLAAIAAQAPGVRAFDALITGKSHDRCGCGCAPAVRAHAADPSDARESETELIDQKAATTLLMAVARVHADQAPEVREAALAALMSVVAAACAMGALVSAHRSRGIDGVYSELGRLQSFAAVGHSGWVPMPMQTMSGGAPGGFGGDLPMPGGGLPGFPKGPGGIQLPGGPGKAVEELLAWVKGRKHYDPEIWDHPYKFWQDPVLYWNEKVRRLMACIIDMRRRMSDRAAIPPPPRPARVTWADGITSITASGACVGDTIVIRGSGLLTPNTMLLLPFADGCRSVPVPPGNWTDTTITLQLPAGVVSGPIGFGDANYIIAYDTWAWNQNYLASEIEKIWCFQGDLPWVPPFRECPPDIGVNRVRAGAAIIVSFTVNGAATAVVEPGATVQLAWTVKNADQIRLDRISAQGPLFGASTSVVDPPGTTANLGMFLHTSAVTCVYRLTAIGPCGTVTQDVTIFASKRPYLTIQGIEVTQGIQNGDNSLALVDRKPTVVRTTVRHGLNGFATNTVPNVQGRIRVRRSDGAISPWINAANNTLPMAPSTTANITVPANPQRNNTNDTLNFLIPPMWCTQSARYDIEVRVVGYGATGTFAGFDQAVTFNSPWFAFQVRRTLELRYIRVNWGGSTPDGPTCFNTLASAIPLLPTPTANIFPLAGVGVQMPSSTDDNGRNNLLEAFDDLHNCSTWEALFEWLGEDCPDDDGTIWVLIPGVFYQGRAFDIPTNVCFTPPSDGPYAAHELAHCFSQRHISLLCANNLTAPGGDPPSAWPNNARLVDVPFDVTRNIALTLTGTGVFDLMTYCGTPNNTWPLPERWNALWPQIGG